MDDKRLAPDGTPWEQNPNRNDLIDFDLTIEDREYAIKSGIPLIEISRAKHAAKINKEMGDLKQFTAEYRTKKPASYWRRAKEKERWFFLRYYKLIDEGFAPEEANIIANAKMSSRSVRKFRAKRRYIYDNVYDELRKKYNGPVEHKEVLTEIAKRIRNTSEEVVDWDSYRRLVYGR